MTRWLRVVCWWRGRHTWRAKKYGLADVRVVEKEWMPKDTILLVNDKEMIVVKNVTPEPRP